MAYLNEYPHVEPNKLNLDWLLEQYSTFNKRIAEILQHFDETVEQIRADFQTAVDTFENQLATFENDINGQFNEFKTEVRNDITTIENAIEQVSDNVSEYVNEHMEEWQLEAMTPETGGVIIGEYNPENVTEGTAIQNLIVNNNRVLLGNNIMTVYNVSKQATQTGTSTTSFGMKHASYNVAFKLSDFLTSGVIENLKLCIGGENELDRCDLYIRRVYSYNDTFEGLIPIINNSFIDRNTTTFSDSTINVNFTLYDLQDLGTTPSSAPYVLLDFAILKRHVL